jgi:hypothetical protein
MPRGGRYTEGHFTDTHSGHHESTEEKPVSSRANLYKLARTVARKKMHNS